MQEFLVSFVSEILALAHCLGISFANPMPLGHIYNDMVPASCAPISPTGFIGLLPSGRISALAPRGSSSEQSLMTRRTIALVECVRDSFDQFPDFSGRSRLKLVQHFSLNSHCDLPPAIGPAALTTAAGFSAAF